MPVPVPRFSKPPSHPVIKGKQRPYNPPDLESLSSSLPPCPSGPPPSFSTREEWIKSLPAWRRDKPRRIWEENSHSLHHPSEQGFPQGLTDAGNAPVIKGVHAEACLPPLYSLFSQFTPDDEEEVLYEDDDMDSDSSMDHSHLDNQSQWTASSPARDIDDIMDGTNPRESDSHYLDISERDYLPEGNAFSPVYEDQSPEEPVSSPMEPVTPFGIFVDRAVADAQVYPTCGGPCPTDIGAQSSAKSPAVFAPFSVKTFGDVPKEPVPVADNVVSVNTGYKKLAEPLANWITDYVWKVCTTGLSLPPPFVALP